MQYLDHAATTPLRPEALEAMAPYLTGAFGNPSSQHSLGEQAARVLADARARVAAVLGVRRSDVVFTSGGTESNNLAVKGIAIAAAQPENGARVLVTSGIEHESVLASAEFLSRVHGFEIRWLPVDKHGRVDPADVAAAVKAETSEDGSGGQVALVSIGYANNEIGTVQDIQAIVAAVRGAEREARGSLVPVHIDAAQAAGWLPLGGLGADAISIAGHKVGAPKGTGVLAVRGRVPVEPLLHGGGQERGRRSGTEPVANAVAIATALELAEAERVENAARVTPIRDEFIARVLHWIPQARLTGHPRHRLPGCASFTFAGTSGEAVLLELERRGVISSSGSACAAGSDQPSHVLLALGIEPEVAQTSVRFTLAHSHRADLAEVADAVAAAVQQVSGNPESARAAGTGGAPGRDQAQPCG